MLTFHRAGDLALLAPQMLRESAATDYDFISAPYNRIIVVREDGTAPKNNGYDAVYFAVKRKTDAFLERLDEDGDHYTDGWTDEAAGEPYTARLVRMPVFEDIPDTKKRIVGPKGPFRYYGIVSEPDSAPVGAQETMRTTKNWLGLSSRFFVLLLAGSAPTSAAIRLLVQH